MLLNIKKHFIKLIHKRKNQGKQLESVLRPLRSPNISIAPSRYLILTLFEMRNRKLFRVQDGDRE